MKPREWRISGGLYLRERPYGPPGNYVADTLQPSMQLAMGENVVVIEHSAYAALLAEAVKLRETLNGRHRCTCPVSYCVRKVLSKEEYDLGCQCGLNDTIAAFDRFTKGQGT